MRVTRHNSRGSKHSKNGYSGRHNDRNFDYQTADNIKSEQTKNNLYFSILSGKFYTHEQRGTQPTFEEVEAKYYKQRFTKQYEAQMQRHIKSRHAERIKSFEDWMKDKKYCPEETVLQIGNIDKHADPKTLNAIAREYLKAEVQFAKEHNDCFEILDAAMHFDEAVPHLQVRKVWRSNIDGINTIGQNKALERAGLSLPYPDEPISKTNNYKITYDRIMREKLLDICEAHGLDVTREPDSLANHDMSKAEMLTQKEHKLRKSIVHKKNVSKRLDAEIESKQEQIEQLKTAEENEILRRADAIMKRRQQRAENLDIVDYEDGAETDLSLDK